MMIDAVIMTQLGKNTNSSTGGALKTKLPETGRQMAIYELLCWERRQLPINWCLTPWHCCFYATVIDRWWNGDATRVLGGKFASLDLLRA